MFTTISLNIISILSCSVLGLTSNCKWFRYQNFACISCLPQPNHIGYPAHRSPLTTLGDPKNQGPPKGDKGKSWARVSRNPAPDGATMMVRAEPRVISQAIRILSVDAGWRNLQVANLSLSLSRYGDFRSTVRRHRKLAPFVSTTRNSVFGAGRVPTATNVRTTAMLVSLMTGD